MTQNLPLSDYWKSTCQEQPSSTFLTNHPALALHNQWFVLRPNARVSRQGSAERNLRQSANALAGGKGGNRTREVWSDTMFGSDFLRSVHVPSEHRVVS